VLNSFVRTAALTGAAAALVLTGAVSASASASPKGDDGTVKVHRSATSPDDPRDEPHVCGFYLAGFRFDGGQQVTWRIVSWPPTGDRKQVLAGALTLGADGHGRTADLSLPDGHYKLSWTFTGEHGRAKQKVFWVRCPGTPPPRRPTSAAPAPAQRPTAAEPSPSGPPATQEPAIAPALPPAPVPTPVRHDLPVTG